MDERVWVDGDLRPDGQGAVSALDRGLTVGHGVFETLKAIGGVPFAPSRHLDRLRHSAARLGLSVPRTDAELRAAMDEVLSRLAGPGVLARLRITVTGGPAPLGPDPSGAPPTVVVAAGPLEPAEDATTACTLPWPRNERGAVAGVKTTSFAENVVAQAHARDQGCTEGLFATTSGLLCEGTGSNVFVVHDGRLVTPTLATGCLAGVTRALVLEVTDAVESDLPITALADAEEVFLTSTTRDVQALHRLDGRDLGPAGPRTRAAATAFAALVARDLDP